jgi:hypothetical protein
LDGSQTGKDGGNGETGKPSPNIKITAGQLLQGSSNKLSYSSKGGEGGDGGNGKDGTAGSEAGLVPTDCQKLIRWPGTTEDRHDNDHEHVCCNQCVIYDYDLRYWNLIDTRQSCGTFGFRGGDGGDGGPAGTVETSPNIFALTTHVSIGGKAGKGGVGGSGFRIVRNYHCRK